MPNKVIANFGYNLAVRTSKGELLCCLTHKRLGLLVCGDYVEFNTQADGSNIIHAVITRKSELCRPDRRGKLKPLAANLDQLIVVVSPEPEPDWLMVTTYLLYAAHHGLKAAIIMNKSDSLPNSQRDNPLLTLNIYQSLGIRTAIISCKAEKGIKELTSLFEKKTSILVGQSGVGKSSIVNFLLPDQQIQINAISALTGLGNHTTSATTLYQLVKDGELIDSPGVRQFSIDYLDSRIIQQNFSEIEKFSHNCKFTNCTHLHEPSCAVRDAVDQNKITSLRWEHYCELMRRCGDAISF